ncbi:hypothetical protein KOAAANKH_03432 [Brevundimonas sp. NIBR10]|nr:hypothetical protein [Brevundimonas sp. NIBR10]WGM48530.1 hypothetical protein KOAAANKH_03432 [Brevundimonas sp. NIBR10]
MERDTQTIAAAPARRLLILNVGLALLIGCCLCASLIASVF